MSGIFRPFSVTVVPLKQEGARDLWRVRVEFNSTFVERFGADQQATFEAALDAYWRLAGAAPTEEGA